MEEQIEDFPINMSPHEDIASCFAAISTLQEYDSAMMDEEEREMIKNIRTMCLYILHIGVSEIYTSNFYGKEDTQSD